MIQVLVVQYAYSSSATHSLGIIAYELQLEYAVGEWAYYVFRITRVRTSEPHALRVFPGIFTGLPIT
jgi:hypothetical protein